MSITAKGFVPREVEDVYGDTATVSVHDVREQVPTWPVRVALVVQDGDPEEYEASTIHLEPAAARALAAHLVQAAEAVEASQ